MTAATTAVTGATTKTTAATMVAWMCAHSWNSLWSSDAVWRQWSVLAQIMVCCLVASSHHLNQCWLIISEDLRNSSKASCNKDAHESSRYYAFENYTFKIKTTAQGTNISSSRWYLIHHFVRSCFQGPSAIYILSCITVHLRHIYYPRKMLTSFRELHDQCYASSLLLTWIDFDTSMGK